MADEKFTIKITPEVDQDWIKNLQKDIKTLESKIRVNKFKNLSPERRADFKLQTSLKSKKSNLNALEKTEKFRLAETKKLMKQGLDFEKARKIAFKKSTMSQEDLRKLEYENLKKKGLVTSKFSKTIDKLKKNTSLMTQAMGSFLGNMGSKIVSGAFALAKKALKDDVTKRANYHLANLSYSEDEKTTILNKLSGFKNFPDLEKSDFVRKSVTLKSGLAQIGINDKDTLMQAIEMSAKLKSSGLADDNGNAIDSVLSLFKGDGDELFNIFRNFNGLETKYGEQALQGFQTGSINDVRGRTDVLKEMLKDFPKEALGYASIAEAGKNSLDKLEDKTGKVMAKGLDALAPKLLTFLNYIEHFEIKKDLIDPFILGFKVIVYALLLPIETLLNKIGLKVDFAKGLGIESSSDDTTKGP